MSPKLFAIVVIAELLLFCSQSWATSANATCCKWVKLNKGPVCFGAKGNQFGRFTYDRNIFASSFMLVHRSGTVSCHTHSSGKHFSYWGCAPSTPTLATLAVILTDQNNQILAPEVSLIKSGGGYQLTGYTSSSSVVVFCPSKKPRVHCVRAGTELRLWYGEDLKGVTESDNGGKTCADVYAMLA